MMHRTSSPRLLDNRIEQRQRKLSLDNSDDLENVTLDGHGAGALAGDGGHGSSSGTLEKVRSPKRESAGFRWLSY